MGLFDRLSDLFGGDDEAGTDDTDDRPTPTTEREDGESDAGADDRDGLGIADVGGRDPAGEDLDLPAVDLTPDMDLDAAHEQAVEAFEEAGYYVTPGELMNSVGGPTEGVGKLFNFQTETGMHTAVVYTGEWDDDATNAVLSLAASLWTGIDLDGLHVVAANEPPGVVSYATGTNLRAAFAVEAMAELADGPEFGPESVPHYADVGEALLAKYFGLEVDRDDVSSLEALDEVVLSQLRPVEDHEQPLDGYVPHEALMLVGALAGEVMRRALEVDLPVRTEWADGGGISSTGVALRIDSTDDDEGASVNPIGKAFKLYESGSTDSLAFMYQTTRQVVGDELT